jgi:hypothetical protein
MWSEWCRGIQVGLVRDIAFEGSHGPVFLLIMKKLVVIETLEHAEHKPQAFAGRTTYKGPLLKAKICGLEKNLHQLADLPL